MQANEPKEIENTKRVWEVQATASGQWMLTWNIDMLVWY